MQQYNKLTPELIAEIKSKVQGPVYEGADINADYQKDEMPIYGTRMPDLAVIAHTTEEISGNGQRRGHRSGRRGRSDQRRRSDRYVQDEQDPWL